MPEDRTMNARVVHEGSWAYPGGAERASREIARALDAPVTVGHSSDPEFWRGLDVELPFQSLNRMPTSKLPRKAKEALLGFSMPTLEFEENVVVTSGTLAKWWVPRIDQVHVHYCHTPPESLFVETPSTMRGALARTAGGVVDRFFANQCTEIVSNSEFTQRRTNRYYGRSDGPVVHPPVETDRFYHSVAPEPRFVMIGRLTEMKRADVVARAFEQLDSELVLVGDGPLRNRCERVENVAVRREVPDDELGELVARSTAGIAFARREHCGITPKEFQAAGKPVVVPDEPNLRNHVEDGVTGVVVPPTVEGVRHGVAGILSQEWDVDRIQAAAEGWSVDRFRNEIRDVVGRFTAGGDAYA